MNKLYLLFLKKKILKPIKGLFNFNFCKKISQWSSQKWTINIICQFCGSTVLAIIECGLDRPSIYNLTKSIKKILVGKTTFIGRQQPVCTKRLEK